MSSKRFESKISFFVLICTQKSLDFHLLFGIYKPLSSLVELFCLYVEIISFVIVVVVVVVIIIIHLVSDINQTEAI